MLDAANEVLSALTESQRDAAAIVDGAALVLAGPGSGKTRVITARIARLVALGVPPWQILALTFTNKAANEMRLRVESLLSADAYAKRGLTVATFHSFCALTLRKHVESAGLKEGFSIYDTGDQREAMKLAIEEIGLSASVLPPAMALSAISDAKNRLVGVDEFAREALDFRSRQLAKAYGAYQSLLQRNNAVDFDDLLVKVATLLRANDFVRRSLQERYRYILIDEYQDTNHAQFVIAHALAAEHGNIFVVGDPDQSIYGWRGADLANILDFEHHFPDATVIPLGRNFRSTGHIVAAASALIQNNVRRKHKDLSTDLGDGEQVVVARVVDEHEEARRIADFLDEAARGGVEWRRMAVLYRMNALSRVIEDELRRRGIPYVVARGTAFWDRKEVKDVLAYLRAIANPADEAALRRIINVPARGIGDASVRRLVALAAQDGTPLGEFLVQQRDLSEALGRSARPVRTFGTLLASWRERAEALPAGELPSFVADVLRESGLDAAADFASEDELEARRNREEIVNAAAEWRSVMTGDDDEGGLPSALAALRDFLASVALVSDQDLVDAARGAVTLLTLHAAKGLEFDTVAIAGLEEGILPHQRAIEDSGDIEEERRLCFVGMTRAERRLMLTVARVRTTRGVAASTRESQFLRELPVAHVAIEERQGGTGFGSIEYDIDAYIGDESGRPRSMAKLFPVGSMVRHPQFGVGRVEQVVDRGANSTARVAFRTVGIKTLVLRFARLERFGG